MKLATFTNDVKAKLYTVLPAMPHMLKKNQAKPLRHRLVYLAYRTINSPARYLSVPFRSRQTSSLYYGNKMYLLRSAGGRERGRFQDSALNNQEGTGGPAAPFSFFSSPFSRPFQLPVLTNITSASTKMMEKRLTMKPVRI